MKLKFNRMELSGSLGDLGTLLPLGLGIIMINGLDPIGIFLSVGLFYIFSGIYFGVTVPVEPMKVIAAYAIAKGVTQPQILASGLLVGIILLVIGGTRAIGIIGKYVPRPVIRGVQLSTGILLISQGVKLMLGRSSFQMIHETSEPFLSIQKIGFLPVGIIIGVILFLIALALLENRKIPAALVVVLSGIIIGVFLGTHEGLDGIELGIHLPQILPFGIPSMADFSISLFLLAIPQLPMTLGNAVIANADLSEQYFKKDSARITYPSLCISMGLANILAFFIGGMPMCHGAGGLASRYRFGARTGGSNIIIGGIFILISVILGYHAVAVLHLIPMSVLGVLLIFSGTQLSLTLIDVRERRDLFVALIILGITLSSNLAVGFITGIILAYILKFDKLKI